MEGYDVMEPAADFAPDVRLPHTAPGRVPLNRSVATPKPAPDWRFRDLVGAKDWATLPDAVQRRFSKRFKRAEPVLYSGHVVETRHNTAGRALAAFASLIGSPLPLAGDAIGAAAVSVIEDAATGYQNWTRIYERQGAFPQVVHSMKRFEGPTGIEEYVGRGIGMALTVTVEDRALVFRSEYYFLQLSGRRVRLPSILAPGVMEIIHRDEPDYPRLNRAFSFTLRLTHPLFGCLVSQLAYFKEVSL
jgi:Domain of unknown function (DUF4166)